MGQSAPLCAELALGTLALVRCCRPVSGMFSSFLPHVRFLFLFKVDRVGPRKWSVEPVFTVQNPGRKTRDSFVLGSPKPSFPPGAPCLQRGPQVCLAELACRTSGAQTLSTALVSTRGVAGSHPCSACCPLCCPPRWPRPQQPCTPCSTHMRRLHGLGPLTWEDRKVMGVTSPPVLPQIMHTYAGPWVMHRLHGDRQAWPLSSPGWRLPAAPGGFSWNPCFCTVPTGFSVRQDVYLGVWRGCLSASWIPGPSRVRSQRPQALPLTEMATQLSLHTWLCLRSYAISTTHPSWALKRGHSLGPWWPCLLLWCFLIPITSQLDFVESTLGFLGQSPQGCSAPASRVDQGSGRLRGAGGSSLSPEQEAAPAVWWGLLATWGWPAARVV